jgi:hypothetical protein
MGQDAVIKEKVHEILHEMMGRSEQDSTMIEILNFYKTLAKGEVSETAIYTQLTHVLLYLRKNTVTPE